MNVIRHDYERVELVVTFAPVMLNGGDEELGVCGFLKDSRAVKVQLVMK